jgi:transposase
MSALHFWLTDAQFARIQPSLPNKPRGGPRVDDRRAISEIIHVVRDGMMWRDAPERYGPRKTNDYRFICWNRKTFSQQVFPRKSQAYTVET